MVKFSGDMCWKIQDSTTQVLPYAHDKSKLRNTPKDELEARKTRRMGRFAKYEVATDSGSSVILGLGTGKIFDIV